MSQRTLRRRRMIFAVIAALCTAFIVYSNEDMWQAVVEKPRVSVPMNNATGEAVELLATIPIKGRAPKTEYSRDKFGNGWASHRGCDTRNVILYRDLQKPVVNESCLVLSGTLSDPYTGKTISFQRGSASSADVQIDHVVALGDAWQKGAQLLSKADRIELANDPLELLAVDGPANQQKSDGDAATWLPPYKPFRCQYVARQIAVKAKYNLWMTQAEYDAILRVLSRCPGQLLPAA